MLLNQFLLLSAVLFCLGVYGVLARKNGMLVLLSVELILNAVHINLVAFGAFRTVVGGAGSFFLPPPRPPAPPPRGGGAPPPPPPHC